MPASFSIPVLHYSLSFLWEGLTDSEDTSRLWPHLSWHRRVNVICVCATGGLQQNRNTWRECGSLLRIWL